MHARLCHGSYASRPPLKGVELWSADAANCSRWVLGELGRGMDTFKKSKSPPGAQERLPFASSSIGGTGCGTVCMTMQDPRCRKLGKAASLTRLLVHPAASERILTSVNHPKLLLWVGSTVKSQRKYQEYCSQGKGTGSFYIAK